MATAEQSVDDSVELFEIAHTDDLDGIELKQDRVRLKSIDHDQTFRLNDHESKWTVTFSGVRRGSSGWEFLFERDDFYTMTKVGKSFPPAIEAVLGRIANLTVESTDSTHESSASQSDKTEQERE